MNQAAIALDQASLAGIHPGLYIYDGLGCFDVFVRIRANLPESWETEPSQVIFGCGRNDFQPVVGNSTADTSSRTCGLARLA